MADVKTYGEETVCESAVLGTDTLPRTVTLVETNSSGKSGTIYINGVRS